MKKNHIKDLPLVMGLLTIAFLVISGLIPDIIPRDVGLFLGMSIIIGYYIVEALIIFPHIEQTQDVLTKLNHNFGIIELIEDSNKYYALLEESIRHAETLRLTHLTRDSPNKLPTPRPKEYWKFFTDNAKKKPDLWIKRISSIDTKDKLKFLEDNTIELKNMKNYGLTYYLPGDIPPLLGFEVIGDKEIFFFGPHAGTGKYIHVTDKILSQGMLIYFDEVWSVQHDKGFILKDMGETDEKSIRDNFSKARKKLPP